MAKIEMKSGYFTKDGQLIGFVFGSEIHLPIAHKTMSMTIKKEDVIYNCSVGLIKEYEEKGLEFNEVK